MKRIVTSQLLFALLIPCCSLTAFASKVTTEGSTSQRAVEYKEFSMSREELEQGRKEQCTVTVSQPYSYSTEIPKDANTNSKPNTNKGNGNVQTGDGTPIALYSGVAILGAMGMMEFKAKSKKTK